MILLIEVLERSRGITHWTDSWSLKTDILYNYSTFKKNNRQYQIIFLEWITPCSPFNLYLCILRCSGVHMVIITILNLGSRRNFIFLFCKIPWYFMHFVHNIPQNNTIFHEIFMSTVLTQFGFCALWSINEVRNWAWTGLAWPDSNKKESVCVPGRTQALGQHKYLSLFSICGWPI